MQSSQCRGCTTARSRSSRDVEWFPLLWECMCALRDPVEPRSGIKWDPRWSSKCHVPTRPLNQTYWSVHTASCPNWHKGQINISRRDWPRWAGKVTRGEWVRDAALGFDRREESAVMFLSCGLWMNMSCVSKSIIQHYYNRGVVCSSRLSHTQQHSQQFHVLDMQQGSGKENRHFLQCSLKKFLNVVILRHRNLHEFTWISCMFFFLNSLTSISLNLNEAHNRFSGTNHVAISAVRQLIFFI